MKTTEAFMARARGFSLKTFAVIDPNGSESRLPSPSIGMSIVATDNGPRVALILVDGSDEASCALFDMEEFHKLGRLYAETLTALPVAPEQVRH